MGKKGRKGGASTRKGGAASLAAKNARPQPSIDIDSIDLTRCCGDCGKDIDLNHYEYWDENHRFSMSACCGHFYCRKCIEQAEELLQETISEALASVAGNPMIMIPPCAACNTPAPLTAEDNLPRLVKLAEGGHSHAQYELACHYEDGSLGVLQDPAMALKWYKKAAEAGHSRACRILGGKYQRGDGIIQSYQEAEYWYENAGDNALALTEFGAMYLQGNGIQADKAKATELFCKAAEQGFPPGLAGYGLMLQQEGRFDEALTQFDTGARLERLLPQHLESIAICQFHTAECLLVKDSFGDCALEDPYPLPLFWARMAEKNGYGDAKLLVKKLETIVKAKCRVCGKAEPPVGCSKCRGAWYCNKTCQTIAWKTEGHRAACKSLPGLLLSEEGERCAGKENRSQKVNQDEAHHGQCEILQSKNR